jgi:hypothetical protein
MQDGMLLGVLLFVAGVLLGGGVVFWLMGRHDRERAYLNQIIGRQQQVIEEQRVTIPEEEL